MGAAATARECGCGNANCRSWPTSSASTCRPELASGTKSSTASSRHQFVARPHCGSPKREVMMAFVTIETWQIYSFRIASRVAARVAASKGFLPASRSVIQRSRSCATYCKYSESDPFDCWSCLVHAMKALKSSIAPSRSPVKIRASPRLSRIIPCSGFRETASWQLSKTSSAWRAKLPLKQRKLKNCQPKSTAGSSLLASA